MQNDSETAAAGLAQGLHTIWEGKGRLREDGKESERGEFNLLLELGLITKAMGTRVEGL